MDPMRISYLAAFSIAAVAIVGVFSGALAMTAVLAAVLVLPLGWLVLNLGRVKGIVALMAAGGLAIVIAILVLVVTLQ